jgi:hypothetical protein
VEACDNGRRMPGMDGVLSMGNVSRRGEFLDGWRQGARAGDVRAHHRTQLYPTPSEVADHEAYLLGWALGRSALHRAETVECPFTEEEAND